MKKLLYGSSALVLLGSFSIVGQQTYAAHPRVPAPPMINVRLCSSAPIGVPGDAHLVQGIFNGVILATGQWKARFRQVGLNLQAPLLLNDAKADGSAVDAAKEASNAQQCLSDPAAMAYIGTLNSSMAQVSEPILNRGGMAMISPSNSNPVLTSPTSRHIYQPATWNHKFKYLTYYRVVTTDNLQGPAGAIYMAKNLGIKSYFLVDDGQTYGVGLATHMDAFNTSGHLGMSKVGTGRVDTSSASAIATSSNAIATQIAAKKPAAVYCGCDEPNAYPLERAARRDGFTGAFVGGDAIFDSSWFKFVGTSRANNTYATFIGLNPAFTKGSFRSAYKRRFPNFVPGPYDALAYDASNIALQAIYKSKRAGRLLKGGPAQRRSSILPYIATVKWSGANGTITFDRNGDTQLRVLSIFKAANGNWNFAGTAPKLPGYLKPTS